MVNQGSDVSSGRLVPALGMALEHGERLVLAVRPQPGSMFTALWALPVMLTVLGAWGASSGSEKFTWDWGLYGLAWVLGVGAFLMWRRGRIVLTDRRIVQRGFLGGINQVRWAEVASVTTNGTVKERLSGYGPRSNPLFVTTKDGRLVRFRSIPRSIKVLELVKDYLPKGVLPAG